MGWISNVMFVLCISDCLAQCSLNFQAPVTSVPSVVAGLNDVMGPIINLTYSDTALLKAARALRVGALRHPGGTVANYWNLSSGSYVVPCKGDHWDYCKYEERISQHPPHTFSARHFYEGVGQASPVAATETGVVWDINVLTLSTAQACSQLDYLKDQNIPIALLEMGNEFYLSGYNWKFPNSTAYMESAKPVIAHARKLFPSAKIAVVAQKGKGPWNGGLKAYRALFDAVTVHDYGLQANMVSKAPPEWQYSMVIGYGEATLQTVAGLVRDSVGSDIEVWMTEYNYPTWASGRPFPALANGALHGMFMTGHILAAIRTQKWNVAFKVLQLHAFLVQDGTGWDNQAGIVKVGRDANDDAAVQVNGVAQIFAHLAHVGLEKNTHMLGAMASAKCPSIPVAIDGLSNTPCVQAAAFVSSPTSTLMDVVLLNKCPSKVNVVLNSTNPDGEWTTMLSTTTYSADDAGGWAAPPATNAAFPWTAPLAPVTSVKGEGPEGNIASSGLVAPPHSLTFALVSR